MKIRLSQLKRLIREEARKPQYRGPSSPGRSIYEEAAKVLEKHLTEMQFVELGEALDGDPENRLLAEVNKLLEKKHPEMFT